MTVYINQHGLERLHLDMAFEEATSKETDEEKLMRYARKMTGLSSSASDRVNQIITQLGADPAGSAKSLEARFTGYFSQDYFINGAYRQMASQIKRWAYFQLVTWPYDLEVTAATVWVDIDNADDTLEIGLYDDYDGTLMCGGFYNGGSGTGRQEISIYPTELWAGSDYWVAALMTTEAAGLNLRTAMTSTISLSENDVGYLVNFDDLPLLLGEVEFETSLYPTMIPQICFT